MGPVSDGDSAEQVYAQIAQVLMTRRAPLASPASRYEAQDDMIPGGDACNALSDGLYHSRTLVASDHREPDRHVASAEMLV
jgi:hypothetical protein